MKRFTLIVIILVLFTGNFFAFSANQDEITIPELKNHITFLASDSLKGRKPGTLEGKIAAEYIRGQLKENGLELLGEDGFQYFKVTSGIEIGENNSIAYGDSVGKIEEDFMPLAFSSNGTVSANVVFVGYGFDFDLDSLAWNDYEGMDVKGKWCMILRGDPDNNNHTSPYVLYSSLRKKVLTAKDHGAAGVLFVSGEKFDKKDELIDPHADKSQSDAGINVIQIKRNLADFLLKESSQTISTLEGQLDSMKTPNSFALTTDFTGTTEVIKTKIQTQNVVALLKSDHQTSTDEYLVIGAHYDHLGFGGTGSGSRRPDTVAVHNGADDNASGVAAIIEIVEKLVSQKQSLKRNIIFIAFGAEEMGTVGSRYFANNPLVELEKIKYMVNVDMIGRMEKKNITVGGTGTAKGLEEIISNLAKDLDINVKMSPEGYGPSDHANFYAKDIPVMFFFTGAHEDYHTPADDVELINFDGTKQVSDFVYDLICELSNLDEALAYQEAGPKTKPMGRRRFKVTLGIMPDVAATDIKGLGVTIVMKDRPAERAGMQKGDIIVAMEGKPVNDIYEYMNRLSDFKVGQRISVEVLRNGEKVILIVEL